MANEDYKSDKIIEIVREFDNTGNKYEVNGMDIAHATPLWRTGNGKFQVIPKGGYRYIAEESNDYLEIQDEAILSTASEFQIIYIYEQESSEYIEDFPSLDILVSKYNQLVKDVTKVFSNLKNIGVKSDTLKMTKTLTELVPFTVWYLNADEELEALPISEMYDKFDQMVNKAYEDVKKLLLVDKEKMSVELREETDLLLEELRALKNKLAEELEEYKDSLKWEDLLNVPATFPSTWATVSGKPTIFPTNWTNVADKPTVFASNWANVADKPTVFASNWANVADKPSTFPTTWATVANKPATFPPAAGTITGNLTVTGVFVCNNDVTAFSDIRLKTNITQLTNALGKLDMINGYNFEYKDRAGEKQVGVIAQEVQTVLPEAVKLTERVFNGEKMLAVNEIKIVPLLIEAIKELKREVDKLKGGKE